MGDKVTRRVEVALQDGMHFRATGANGVSVSVDAARDDGIASAGPTPMEMLLIALGGCTAMDVISILRKKRQPVTAYRVEVSAIVADEIPHVFTQITLRHVVEGSSISDDAVRHAIELSETKYCSAYAMLAKSAGISSTYQILDDPGVAPFQG